MEGCLLNAGDQGDGVKNDGGKKVGSREGLTWPL